MIVADSINLYWSIALNALFVGIGSAAGNYLFNQHLIKKASHIKKKLLRRYKIWLK